MNFSLLKDNRVIAFNLGAFYQRYTVDRDADIKCAEKRITDTSFRIMEECFSRIGKSDYDYREKELHKEIMQYKNAITGVCGEHGYSLVVGADYIRTFNTFRNEPDADDKEIRAQVDPNGLDAGANFPYVGVYEDSNASADPDDTEIVSVGIEYLNKDIISYDNKHKVFINSIEQLRDWATNIYPIIRLYGYNRAGHLRQNRFNEVYLKELRDGNRSYSEMLKKYELGINIGKENLMLGKSSEKTLYMCRRTNLLPIPTSWIKANSTARKFFISQDDAEKVRAEKIKEYR